MPAVQHEAAGGTDSVHHPAWTIRSSPFPLYPDADEASNGMRLPARSLHDFRQAHSFRPSHHRDDLGLLVRPVVFIGAGFLASGGLLLRDFGPFGALSAALGRHPRGRLAQHVATA